MSTSQSLADRVRGRLQDDPSPRAVTIYKVTTALSWLLAVVTSIYYTVAVPTEGTYARRTIWGQNFHHHTPFALNSIIVSMYWLVLFILQIGYTWHFYANDSARVRAAADVGLNFVLHNLFLFGFIHLWVRSHFWLAELVLILNFFNLTGAYFKSLKTSLFVHVPAVSGPLAWNFVALYWCGAVAFNAHSLGARILANIAIWGILAYGLFFLAAYRDYSMGFALSILAAALGVSQFLTHVIAFQWIFAFIIMTILFVLSTVVAIPGLVGDDFLSRERQEADRERAPLLAEE